MVHTFNIKEIQSALFGVLESDLRKWRGQFVASPPHTPIRIDSGALKMVARDLGKDGKSLDDTAWRYVRGAYRKEVDGFGASLGDVGEMLTFLIYKAKKQDIVRVVSAVRGKKTVKGDRFPTPDFVIQENGNLAVVEVKSTQAFDYVKLLTKKWSLLQPCSRVQACREEALPQLGYVSGTINQAHQLRLRGGTIMPFRASKGIAVAVLAVDGRSKPLRSQQKYKTPIDCLPANECWKCVPSDCDFAMVHMPNSPDRLALAGSPAEGAPGWLRAYRRWSQALAARDLIATRSTLAEFASAMGAWLDSPQTAHSGKLSSFWRHYLDSTMRSRGIMLPVPPFGQHAEVDETRDDGYDDTPVEPRVRELGIEALAAFLLNSPREGRASASAKYFLGNTYVGSMTVRHTPSALEIELLSAAWQEDRQVDKPDQARQLIAQLLFFVARSTNLELETADWSDFPIKEFPLRALGAHVGDQHVFLGWALDADEAVAYLFEHFEDWVVRTWMHFWPNYELDRDTFITVRPDGRVLLQAPRT